MKGRAVIRAGNWMVGWERRWKGVVVGTVRNKKEMEEGRGVRRIIGVRRSLGWIEGSFIKTAQV